MKSQGSKVENRTFGYGSAFWMNACVGRNGGPYSFWQYAEGYFEAAEKLALGCEERCKMIDVLVYPIAFNYRHAIELSIKHLGIVLPRLWAKQAPLRWTHKLADNWTTVKQYLQMDSCFDPDGSIIAEIDELIDNLLEIDPNGEVFRYPSSKMGQGFLLDQGVISIERLSKAMARAREIFEAWDLQVGLMWEAQYERAATC